MARKLMFIMLLISSSVYASPLNSDSEGNILLWLAMILFVAGLSMFIQRFGQPSVLSQLAIGMLVPVLAHYNIWQFFLIQHSSILAFVAEIGIIFLMFEIGLESNVEDLKHSGKDGVIVALLGIIIPFLLGYFLITPYIIGSSSRSLGLFVGATIATTSTGITISVFKELKYLKSKEAQIVLAASVIDDILGLVLLAIVTGIIAAGSFKLQPVLIILLKVLIFFTVAILFGKKVVPLFTKRILIRINNGEAMMLLIVIAFCLLLSWFSHFIGLATIIGAFLAGLLLDRINFAGYSYPLWHRKLSKITQISPNLEQSRVLETEILQSHDRHRLEDIIKPFSNVCVPVFFIYAGMQINIMQAISWHTLYMGLVIGVLALFGKLFCGIFLPHYVNRWVVGFGMAPRGEVGLIFAITGKSLGLVDDNLFTAILIMVVLTSFITPIMLTRLIKRKKQDGY